MYWLFLVGYFLIMLVGPFVIVSSRYGFFEETTKSITGFGICVALAFLVVGLRFLKDKIKLLPENTIAQRRVKISLQLVYSLIFPVACVFILYALWSNFELAFSVIRDCLVFIFIGIFIDYFFIKFIECERTIRFETQRDSEKAKRMHLFK
jgi:hypothetical protein